MHKQKSDKFTLTHANKIQLFLILFDIVAVNVAYFGALWLRFDCKYTTIEPQYIVAWTHFTPIYTVLVIIIFWLCSLYNSIWRFAGYKELSNGIIATALTGLVQCIGITVFFERMPITYYVFGIVLQFCFTMAIRFMYRFIILLHDVRINRNCIVSAGSVVTSDIPENSVVAGNPAQVIGRFDMYCALRKMGKNQNVAFKNQELPESLAEAQWAKFEKKRNRVSK